MTERILVIGSGGREHAIGWKIRKDDPRAELYFAPGNAGTKALGTNIDIQPAEIEKLKQFALAHHIDFTVVGPEATLALGIVDVFTRSGLPIFGPTRSAALLETDKAFAVRFMKKYSIPHPDSAAFIDFEKAKTYISRKGGKNIVIKAAGLAAGKGVFLPEDTNEAVKILERIMVNHTLGTAGKHVVIQERLTGREVSVLAFCDGKTVVPLLPAQDHKRLRDGDTGPMTGGVGAIAPIPFVHPAMVNKIQETILRPTIDGMRQEGHPFVGILYAGLMLTADGPKVLEYNARFGDPETQSLVMLLKSNLFPLLLACTQGTLLDKKISFYHKASVCVVLTSKGYPGIYEKGKHIKGLEKENGIDIQIFHAGTIEKKGKVFTHGGRVVGVTATGKNISQSRARVYGAIGKNGIHFDGMHYRKDI